MRTTGSGATADTESEDRFRAMADCAPVMIWIADTSSACIWFNRLWLEFTGRTLEEEFGSGWAQGVHPDDLQDCLDCYVHHFDRREPFRMEYRLRRHDGEYRWIDDAGTARSDADGSFIGYIGSCSDITERKLAEESLRTTAALLEQTQRITGIGGWEYVVASGTMTWTDEVYRIYGVPDDYDPSNIANDVAFYAPEHQEIIERAFRRAIEEGVPYDLELRFFNAEGFHKWVRTCGEIERVAGRSVRVYGNIQDITRRKQMDIALRASEGKYRILVETSEDAIILADTRGWHLYRNPAYYRGLGYAADEDMGSDDDLARVHPEDIEGLKGKIAETIDVGRSNSEYRVRHKNGHWVHLSAKMTAITDEMGLPVSILITIRDISERKKMEEAATADQRRSAAQLRISQHDFRSLQELLDVALEEAIGLSGSRFGYIYFYSEEKEEFTLHAWSSEVMHACTVQDPQTVYQLSRTGIWGEAVRQRGPITVNNFAASNPLKKGYPEGHVALFRFMTAPIFRGNRIVAVVGVANKTEEYTEADLNQLTSMLDYIWRLVERRQAEDALHEREERLRLALMASNQGLYDLNVQTREVAVSPEYATMMGYDLSGFRETTASWRERVHPEDLEATAAAYRACIDGKTPYFSAEFRQRGCSGEWISILSLGKIVQRDKEGRPLRLVGTNTNVTERRKIMDELRELNRNLNERVREEVEKNRAQEHLLQLQSRHAAMGEMIRNIAHQWRQPLNNLALSIQGLQMKAEAGEMTAETMEEHVQDSMDMIMYMSQTIDDFRLFFKQDKTLATFRLKEVAEKALGFVGASFSNHAIAHVIEIADDVSICAYRNEYMQVLVNILNNAKDVLVERGVKRPRIRVSAFRENNAAILTITDNGGGIPISVMDRIFDPYFTTKEQGKGTGLGLYISRTIIEQNMGGKLSACNRENGAEFRIEVSDAGH